MQTEWGIIHRLDHCLLLLPMWFIDLSVKLASPPSLCVSFLPVLSRLTAPHARQIHRDTLTHRPACKWFAWNIKWSLHPVLLHSKSIIISLVIQLCLPCSRLSFFSCSADPKWSQSSYYRKAFSDTCCLLFLLLLLHLSSLLVFLFILPLKLNPLVLFAQMPLVHPGFSQLTNIRPTPFVVHIRPPYLSAINDVIRFHDWREVIYLYDSDDGKDTPLHLCMFFFSLSFSICRSAAFPRSHLFAITLLGVFFPAFSDTCTEQSTLL